MEFIFLTLTPEMLSNIFQEGIIADAVSAKKIKVELINFREFALDKHYIVDDTPYGGGGGMLLKPEPIIRAFESIELKPRYKVIITSPAGRRFEQKTAAKLAEYEQLIFICGRYEGIDERVFEILNAEAFSIGDYVLSNGELAASVMFNAVARLIPGVIGNPDSLIEESFENGLLEYPHYTRPDSFRNFAAPEVLKNGNHKLIREWRFNAAKNRTTKLKEVLSFEF